MLPELNADGDLPVGVHPAPLEEVCLRFGTGSQQRRDVTERLRRIYALALSTGQVRHFLVFGSYITDKNVPNDVDVVLVMQNDFKLLGCVAEQRTLFDHEQADKELGASIFWIRPALLLGETLTEFIAHWQVKRGKTRRGIVEIV